MKIVVSLSVFSQTDKKGEFKLFWLSRSIQYDAFQSSASYFPVLKNLPSLFITCIIMLLHCATARQVAKKKKFNVSIKQLQSRKQFICTPLSSQSAQ